MAFVKKKIIYGLLIFVGIILLIGILLVVWANIKAIRLYFTPISVTKGTIRSQIVFPGTIDFDQRALLEFQQIPSSGVTVSYVGVKVGDTVKKGQLLASLNQDTIAKQQQINLNLYLKSRMANDQALADNGNLQSLQYAQTDTQKRTLMQDQADLENSVYNVELQSIIQKLSNLYSPLDGVMTRVDTPVAGVNIISPDEARFEVVNPKTFFFNADIDESEVSNLHPGDKGVVLLNAYPTRYIPATIRTIAFSSHQDANNNTVYTVKLDLNSISNDTYDYRVGMSGSVIFYEYAENIASVPNDYLHQDDAGTYLYEGKQKKKVYIQTGISDGKNTEVMKGISLGDIIYY